MNQAREQFYKTTAQYFQANQTMNEKISYEINFPTESQKSEVKIKKFYIKEGPFVNYSEK